MLMRAAIFRRPHEPMMVEEVEIADPIGKEVLVRTAASGVCHSDKHSLDGLVGARWQGFDKVVLGHEGSGVVEAVELIGSTQIQGRASFVGNLCNASPAADSVPALIAAGATVVIAGPDGEREVPVEDVPTAPGRTSLAKGEMVIAVRLPPKPARTGDAYLRFIPRTEMDIAVVGAGVCVTLDDGGTCTAAKVSLGAVAPTVLVVPDAAAALVGSRLDDAALAGLDAAARAACKPIDDKRGTIEYRTKVAGVLARRAAATAFKRAGA